MSRGGAPGGSGGVAVAGLCRRRALYVRALVCLDSGLDSKWNGKPLESRKQRHGGIWLSFLKACSNSGRKLGCRGAGSRET